MSKGELKVKKRRAEAEEVSFDPRLSQDKRTFVLVIESGRPLSWYDCVLATFVWAKDERDVLQRDVSDAEH